MHNLLPKTLKIIRQHHKISQTELACKLNMPTSLIYRMELGEATISLDMLIEYSNYFEIPISYLFMFAEELENNSIKSYKELLFMHKKLFTMMNWYTQITNKNSTTILGDDQMLVELTESYRQYKEVLEDSKIIKKVFEFTKTVYINSNRVNYLSKNDKGLTVIYFDNDYITVVEPLDKVIKLLCI